MAVPCLHESIVLGTGYLRAISLGTGRVRAIVPVTGGLRALGREVPIVHTPHTQNLQVGLLKTRARSQHIHNASLWLPLLT